MITGDFDDDIVATLINGWQRARRDEAGLSSRRVVGEHRRWIRAGHTILTAMIDHETDLDPAARRTRIQQLGRDILDHQQLVVPAGPLDTRST